MITDLEIREGSRFAILDCTYKIKYNTRSNWQKNDFMVINEKNGKYVFSGTSERIARILNEFHVKLI